MISIMSRVAFNGRSILELSRSRKRLILTLLDAGLVPLTLYFAFLLRYGEVFQPDPSQWTLILITIPVSFLLLQYFGVYKDSLRHAGRRIEMAIFKACFATGLLLSFFVFLGQFQSSVPRSVPAIFISFVILRSSVQEN